MDASNQKDSVRWDKRNFWSGILMCCVTLYFTVPEIRQKVDCLIFRRCQPLENHPAPQVTPTPVPATPTPKPIIKKPTPKPSPVPLKGKTCESLATPDNVSKRIRNRIYQPYNEALGALMYIPTPESAKTPPVLPKVPLKEKPIQPELRRSGPPTIHESIEIRSEATVPLVAPERTFYVTPQYPPLAYNSRISGNVDVKFTVFEDGSVGEIQILYGNPILAESVKSALRSWKFRSAHRGGIPEKYSKTMTFNFKRYQE